MTNALCTFIRTLGVAALLAAAAISLPVGDVDAAGKDCTMPKNVPGVGGTTYPDGGKHIDDINGKTYICDNGSWIIITDEKFDPGSQPPQPRFPRVFGVPGSGGVLAQP